MRTDTPSLFIAAFAVTTSVAAWADAGAAFADDRLPYNTDDSCDEQMRADLAESIDMARQLLLRNRQDNPDRQFPLDLVERFFGVKKDPAAEADQSWNTLFELIVPDYEAFVEYSFTNPEQQTYPIQGKRITFRCNGMSEERAAQPLEFGQPIILLNPSFTGKLAGFPHSQLPLIEKDANDTRAGTILHEMVHVFTGGDYDICKAKQCFPSDQAEKNATAHDVTVFRTPANYEYFYQYSYWHEPAL